MGMTRRRGHRRRDHRAPDHALSPAYAGADQQIVVHRPILQHFGVLDLEALCGIPAGRLENILDISRAKRLFAEFGKDADMALDRSEIAFSPSGRVLRLLRCDIVEL
jgi:hypothetical protein